MANGIDNRLAARRLRRGATALTLVALTATAPLAMAAEPGRYKGRTSQGREVELRVTSPTRMNVERIVYRGRCDNGRRFTATSNIRQVRVRINGRFVEVIRGRGRIVGIGTGRFRMRLTGDVRPNVTVGKLRVVFRAGGIVCRSGGVPFTARRR